MEDRMETQQSRETVRKPSESSRHNSKRLGKAARVALALSLAVGGRSDTLRPNNLQYLSSTPNISIDQQEPSAANSDRAGRIVVPDIYAKQLAERMSDETPLSQRDQEAKERILEELKNSSAPEEGIVFKNDNVAITFEYRLGIFVTEILTTNIDLAKSQGDEWLARQGLSEHAVCRINSYYPSSLPPHDVVGALPQGTLFNPNSPSCE